MGKWVDFYFSENKAKGQRYLNEMKLNTDKVNFFLVDEDMIAFSIRFGPANAIDVEST